MKKATLVIAMTFLSVSAHAATVQSVAYSGGLASAEGWSLSGSGGEFNNGTDWAIFGGPQEATRGLGGDLSIGQTVSIDLATLGVASGDFVGVDFRQGTTTGIGYNFEGFGATGNYGVFSASGVTNSGIGFSTNFKTIALKRDTSSNYTLSIDGPNFSSLTLANSATAINEIRVFNNTSGSGNDVLFDNFNVIAVPEPSSAALLGLGGLALILRRRK
ncbi:MAG: PEP-CTERM sorting domain-containing protein [Verrucomicrobiae bacterium]|nr:PEP-CTERM sorting domain-containing protein [Verrucomicrobiae bacterium]NNJ85751.1 PEP-CTERM sorting domain-containing protein [Akkermansiaceae bacterium]